MKASEKYNIILKNVSFSYDDSKTVLDNINFKFEYGKKYAVVGMSGSGKTTLIRLLMGYYDNYCGDILFGDTELRNINLESLYEDIAIVQQSTFLFEDSIKNNLLLYSNHDEAKLNEVIKQVGLSDYINQQENGLEHIITEGGKNISGGEKQRISIARTLIKDCKILLLDEFTSNLDTALSYEIEKGVLELKSKTEICVTHKLNKNILKLFDEILVMKNGKIIESGNFDKLMGYKGMFYSMYNVEN
jgi:ATP-binding cassette subfamily C protein